MNFDPRLNQLGLYYIPSSNDYISYFLKRSWGNYLFFPHPEIEKMYPFILASGGIYKVFDSKLPYPFYNKLLFDKFGAPTIGVEMEYHEDFLIEKYPDEYFDVDLKINKEVFELNFKGEVLRFIDGEIKNKNIKTTNFYRLK